MVRRIAHLVSVRLGMRVNLRAELKSIVRDGAGYPQGLVCGQESWVSGHWDWDDGWLVAYDTVSRALTPYHLLSCCSFKTAWVSYEEHDTMASLWGEPDIVAKDLDDCARQIIERETQLARG